MPYAEIGEGTSLYYELTGPENAPVVLQFGGGLFGRHNFGLVNDGFRERFRLLSVGARFMESSEGENIFQLVRDLVGLTIPTPCGRLASRLRRWISLRSCRRSLGRC